MSRKMITIKDWDGDDLVNIVAETYHYLSIHRTVGRMNDWSVTHLPTGFACYAKFATREQAREYVRHFRSRDWEFSHKDDIPKTLRTDHDNYIYHLKDKGSWANG